jgi:hypothetical protein
VKTKDVSRKELLASTVAVLGASLAAGVASTAADAAAMTAGKNTTVALRKITGAQLEAQAASAQDPVRGAILKAAAEQIRQAGGEKADFDLSFGLHWGSVASQAGRAQ